MKQKKLNFELFKLDRDEVKFIEELSKKEFCLHELKKIHGRNKIERLAQALKEMGILEEIGTKSSPKGKKSLKIFRLNFGEGVKTGRTFYSKKKDVFLKVFEKIF